MKLHTSTLITLLFAASPALTTPTTLESRQARNLVKNGSFENISQSSSCPRTDISGYWTFNDQACATSGNTSYGSKYVDVFSFGGGGASGIRGSATQTISGLSTRNSYKLSYAYIIERPAKKDCTLSVTFGGQSVDGVVLPSDAAGGTWITRSETFTPSSASGTLSIGIVCPRPAKPQWSFGFDNVKTVAV